jgi:type II secretory pathway predicted ATPase ExeA
MYEGHFQLERRPFSATPDASCCFLSPSHAPQFQNVVQCVEQGRGIAILTGPAGIGKTLLAQVLLTELESRFTGVYLGTGQFPTRRAFLQAILYELGQPYGGMTDQELRLELNTALRNLITQKDGLLLVLDEAHILSDRLLEEVRLLADLAHHGVPLVRAVLCGNPEFEERLTAPSLSAFNQRVACHESLETLLRSESIDYLEYRVQWAGATADRLFEPAAMRLIAEASDGVPRCLNQLAEHSLTQAFRAHASIASESIVRQALAAVQHLPLRWNASALLTRSWSSTAEASETSSSVSSNDTPRTEIASQTEDLAISDESASSCFEFGAGDDSDSTKSLSHFDRQTNLDETVSEPAAPASVSNAIATGSIDRGGRETLEFGDSSFEFAHSTAAGEAESASFEIGGPTPSAMEIGTQSTSSELTEEIMGMHATSESRERKVFLRVALSDRVSLNDTGSNKVEPAHEIIAGDSAVDTVPVIPSIHAGAHVEYQQSMTSNDENIDHDQPRFAWLNHPVELSELESGPVFNSSLSEAAISELKFSSRIRARSQAKTQEIELVDTSVTRSVKRKSPQSGASRPGVMGPKMHRSAEQEGPRDESGMNRGELEEEVVIDRYAALDADRRPVVQWSAPGLKAPTSQPAAYHTSKFVNVAQHEGVEDQSGSIATPAETEQRSTHPDRPESTSESLHVLADDEYRPSPMEQFDSICALIETADDRSNGGSGVELITDWGVERIDVDLSSETNALDLTDANQQMPCDITDWLGSTVVEVGRDLQIKTSEPRPESTESLQCNYPREVQSRGDELQHSQADSRQETAATPQSPIETVIRASQYDIVEPDPDDGAVTADNELPDVQQPADSLQETLMDEELLERPVRTTTHSRFHNLFSSLRRREVPARN